MAPGARSKFGAPMFKPEPFWKQMYCIEESTCDICWDFSAQPRSDSAPSPKLFNARGIVPLAPLVTPLMSFLTKTDEAKSICAWWHIWTNSTMFPHKGFESLSSSQNRDVAVLKFASKHMARPLKLRSPNTDVKSVDTRELTNFTAMALVPQRQPWNPLEIFTAVARGCDNPLSLSYFRDHKCLFAAEGDWRSRALRCAKVLLWRARSAVSGLLFFQTELQPRLSVFHQSWKHAQTSAPLKSSSLLQSFEEPAGWALLSFCDDTNSHICDMYSSIKCSRRRLSWIQ